MNGKYSNFFVKPDAFVTEVDEDSASVRLIHADSEITIFSDKKKGRGVGKRKLEEQAQVLAENMDSIICYSQNHQKNKLSIVESIILLCGGGALLLSILGNLSVLFTGLFAGSGLLLITFAVFSNQYKKKKNQIELAKNISQEIGIYKAFAEPENRKKISKALLADKDGNITRGLSDCGKEIVQKSQDSANNKDTNMCDILFIDRIAQYCPDDGYKILESIDRLASLDEVAEFDDERYPWNNDYLGDEEGQVVSKVRRKTKNNY